MAAIWNVIRHKYLGVSATVAMLLLLPLVVISSQRTQNSNGLAQIATTIVFSPTSTENEPLEINLGQEFSLNVLVNPGRDKISIIKLDINYDPTVLKFSKDNPIEINNSVFTKVIEGPSYSAGNLQMTLSVGKDLSNSISNRTSVVNLNFIPISKTLNKGTIVSFGKNTSASGIEVNNISKENTVSTTTPSYIIVN